MTAISSWAAPRDGVNPVAIGGKAAGLFRLPDDWTPPFFVVGKESDYHDALESLLIIAECSSDQIIVRSNARSENDSAARGSYTSTRVAPDHEAVREAVEQVLAQPTRPEDEMFAIVQLAIKGLAEGHLSNERHVAERRTQWIVDEEGLRSIPEVQTLTARDNGTDALAASDRAGMLTTLRHVAFRLSADEERVHCEWIWDGARTWVVQRDTAVERRGGHVHDYLGARPASSPIAQQPKTTLIRRLTTEDTSSWSKLGRPTILQALGMPTAPVWHLDGEAFLADRQAQYRSVMTDLEKLMERKPLVVRCDVRAGLGYHDLSLPTSDPVSTPAAAVDFMKGAASRAFESLPAGDWAFLPAPLVNARASIMAQARPGGQRVRLHALWGFPDGVGLLGHDKWSCDMTTGTAEERRSHKSSCWLPMGDAGWSFESVPAPFDWGHTIDRLEASTAASWARRLADYLDREVQLMALTRIDGQRGPDAMLAWHYTDHIVPPAQQHVAIAPSEGVRVITSPTDLQSVDLGQQRGILLRPELGIHRDASFLAAVGKRAAEADVPIYFEGSILGHPYYLLRSSGATVVPVGRDEPGGVRIEYNKLVRDGVPDVIRSSGGSARVVKASREQAHGLLRHKLVEETFEVSGARDGQLIEELADLADVIASLMRHAGIDPDAVERMREEKRAARGGFDDLLYLEATSSDVDDEPNIFDAPSLFGDEHSSRQVPPLHDSPPAVTIEESNTHRLVLRVSAMPPMRDGIPLGEYLAEIGEGTVTFRHDGAEIEITLERGEPLGIEQLQLPIDME